MPVISYILRIYRLPDFLYDETIREDPINSIQIHLQKGLIPMYCFAAPDASQDWNKSHVLR